MAQISIDYGSVSGGSSKGVYITVECDSAYQGYDIILTADGNEIDKKQCSSSLKVTLFASANTVTLPTTFTISNSLNGNTLSVSASMYGWYERELELFNPVIFENGVFKNRDIQLSDIITIASGGTVSVSGNNLVMYSSGGNITFAWKLDELSKYNYINFNLSSVPSNPSNVRLGYSNTVSNDSFTENVGYPNSVVSGTNTVAITNKSQAIYLKLDCWRNTVSINKIWLS